MTVDVNLAFTKSLPTDYKCSKPIVLAHWHAFASKIEGTILSTDTIHRMLEILMHVGLHG